MLWIEGLLVKVLCCKVAKKYVKNGFLVPPWYMALSVIQYHKVSCRMHSPSYKSYYFPFSSDIELYLRSLSNCLIWLWAILPQKLDRALANEIPKHPSALWFPWPQQFSHISQLLNLNCHIMTYVGVTSDAHLSAHDNCSGQGRTTYNPFLT